jgi:hypothetical protein
VIDSTAIPLETVIDVIVAAASAQKAWPAAADPSAGRARQAGSVSA